MSCCSSKYTDVLSEVVIYNQATPSLLHKLPAVTLLELEKEATLSQVLLFSSA